MVVLLLLLLLHPGLLAVALATCSAASLSLPRPQSFSSVASFTAASSCSFSSSLPLGAACARPRDLYLARDLERWRPRKMQMWPSQVFLQFVRQVRAFETHGRHREVSQNVDAYRVATLHHLAGCYHRVSREHRPVGTLPWPATS